MCGLAGVLHTDGSEAEIRSMRAMGEAIAHRGPDGAGQYTDGPLGLAHRRLAVLDLTDAGRQPMQTPDGRYVLAFVGEIYNFRDLRPGLEALGHRFRSRTDTEVLLYALAQWGVDAIGRLNGMFAFALWDCATRELLLTRDRYGIKPLYVTEQKAGVIFGSEVKAILAHPGYSASLDKAGLLEYLTFQNFLTDRTLFRDVTLLPAGTWMRVRADGHGTTRRYWDYAFTEPDDRCPTPEYEEALDCALHQAVSRQLVGDVPVGTYLSGGMDSGTVTALAARQLTDIRSFTVGFDLHSASGLEMGFDEREAAEHMSYLFKTEHYEVVLKAGDMERCLKRLVWHLEEPRTGQSYPNFYAAQLASRFGKVVLSGTGGDELFGGYPWRYYRAAVNDDFDHYVENYYGFWQRLIPAASVTSVFAPIWNDVKGVSPKEIFRDVFQTHANRLSTAEDYINHSLYFEAKTFLHGLLVVEDKLSMAHGLETRVPFLDNDLVDLAMRIPTNLKLGNLGEVVRLNENEPGSKTRKFFEHTRDGKLILRNVMRRVIPASVADGIKHGFSGPDASWFRGESIDYVRGMLYSPNARIFDFLDRRATLALVDDHLEGRENRRLLIWSLLNLEQWCESFVSGRFPLQPTGAPA
jgi:asparagine synthase (glutamine-hydrolysing)